MKKIAVCILLVFGYIGFGNSQSMYSGVDFDVKMNYVYTIEEALSKAKQQNKLIFFNCFADWAVPCHSMNKNVFSDQQFADWMDKHFVNLFVDVTKGDGRVLAKKYNTYTMAHYLILDYDGEVVHRIVGGSPIPEFKLQIAQSLNPKTSLRGMNEAYDSGNRKVKFLREYFPVLRKAEEDDRAKLVLDEFFNQIDSKQWSKKENWGMFLAKMRTPDSEQFKYLLNNRAAFEKSNGAEEVANTISRIFSNNLIRYSAGISTYDANSLLDTYLLMQKANLPKDDASYSFYEFAKNRLNGNVAAMIEILNDQKDIWDSEVLRNIDLSLSSLKDLSIDDKKLLTSYWQERADFITISTRNHYLSAINALNVTTGIKFEDITFEQAIEKAKKENKLVFMDCYTVWCGPCKWLDNNTFVDETLGDYFNEKFINIKIDMEKGEGAMLMKKYDVKAFPTLLLLNGEQEVVNRITGALSAKDLMNKIESI